MKMKKILNIMLWSIMLVMFIMSLAMSSMAVGKAISYKSTRNSVMPSKYSYLVNNFIEQNEKYDSKNFYFVLDNYDLYKYLGFSDKSKSFFNDNLLIINRIMSGGSIYKTYINKGITINDGILNVSYNRTVEFPATCDVKIFTDIIELKKSDVKGVDLTKEIVTTQTVYKTSMPEDTQSPDTYYTEQLVYVDVEKLIQKPAYNTEQLEYINDEKLIQKPDKVEKVKVKAVKKKQLKVSWKNIKGVKYEVKYSLKKGMKNAKVKKNIKKNKVTLKKLKSGKKYYIKVRAYQKIGNKTYTGKWSKKVSKTVK